jgi:ornithine carbamoyltransferase
VTKTLVLAEALKDADYVHTDTWMDMEFFDGGKIKPEFEDEYNKRNEQFKPYQLNAEIIDKHCPKAGIMHCMPCHVGYEISRDAIDHKNSVIYDQAENRLHGQKGIMVWLMEQEDKVK